MTILVHAAAGGVGGQLASSLFDALAGSTLTTEPGEASPLHQAARAHEMREARSATGPLLMIPGDEDA